MKPIGSQCRHYWLLQDMAKATQVDLARAFREGRISTQEWAGMVGRCRACSWPDGCQSWLRRTPGPRHIPARCCNRARLALLKIEEELDCT
ncbi:DUF6455 family protein [Roseovarius pacificus]|uniref:DUF6455 family protein n=1 Tax=Roseovarius pacificus TaxID=337701 RepID=UPI0009346521|nr:DUF6455 family protein [Roseovarius pacificus]